jgi:O-antigen/teichoic acid export membrane protein
MKKLEKLQILKNVGSSWFGLGVNVIVGLFLSPYILHHLGDEAFGVWVLIFSVTGYYGLFDLGIRSSIVRYVAKYTATKDYEEMNRLINTAMFSYSVVGVLAMLITVSASVFVSSIFRIPPSFLITARWLFLMVGSAVALGFPFGVFGGILEGLQRFYLLNFTNITSLLLRAVLIVIALQHGRGLLTVALITVTLPLLGAMVNGAVVLRILPLHFGLKHVDRASLRRIANYSSATLMIMVAGRLRFKTDAMVIGTFVGSAAITFFTIGSRLVDYASDVVTSMAQIFVPMSSHSDAKGDLERLRKIFVAGNRACALVIFPIAAILIVLGKSVIEAWVGARYVATSYPVLLILLIPSTLLMAQAASSRILFGIGKHRTLAVVILLEGVANLILSIVLVRRFGIIGDAVGTAIPLTLTTLYFLPRHLCRVLKLRLWTYVHQAFLLPLTLTVPLTLVLLLLRHWFVAHHYLQLAFQLLIGSAVYGVGLLWAIWTKRAWQVEGVSLDEESARETSVALIETYQHEEA